MSHTISQPRLIGAGHIVRMILSLFVTLSSFTAYANLGDLLNSFTPTPSGNGRAVAFDPDTGKLYYTIRELPSTRIFITDARNSPTASIDPGLQLRSLSWDAKRGVLWGGTNVGGIYQITPQGVAELQFNIIPPGGNCYGQTPGVIDGLAYDEGPTQQDNDDSLWIGDDGGFQIHRVTLNGQITQSFTVPKDPRSGNPGCRSGIAVDGQFLWLALQSGADTPPYDIVKVAKSDPSTMLASFPFVIRSMIPCLKV